MADKSTQSVTLDTIAVGDCLQAMAAFPQASVDLIFADPPYNIGFKYDQYEDTRNDEYYIQWTQDWITACARLLKPTGSCTSSSGMNTQPKPGCI
ncbi:MAG: hypothetical protein HC898_11155 [Phycisphaerales bacterium]|nr:hypothetical protein [Phycisphaerales bacterium]